MATDEAAVEAGRWLGLAEDDLAAAEATAVGSEFRPRHTCWYSQQAAEKALKAVLVLEQIAFPFSHDLEQLSALAPTGWGAELTYVDLPSLSRWATEGRYPDTEEPTSDDASSALASAQEVVRVAAEDLRRRGVA